jgi:hypothetical protein
VDAEGSVGGGEIATGVREAELGLGLVERRQVQATLIRAAAS